MESCFENQIENSKFNDTNGSDFKFPDRDRTTVITSDLLTAKEISPNSTRLEQNTWMLPLTQAAL